MTTLFVVVPDYVAPVLAIVASAHAIDSYNAIFPTPGGYLPGTGIISISNRVPVTLRL